MINKHKSDLRGLIIYIRATFIDMITNHTDFIFHIQPLISKTQVLCHFYLSPLSYLSLYLKTAGSPLKSKAMQFRNYLSKEKITMLFLKWMV